MKRFVLDASVSLAWFVDFPMPSFAARVRQSLENGSTGVVPSLWHLEMANGFVIAEHRGAIPSDAADRCLDDIESMMVSGIEESTSAVSLRQAHTAARTFRLSAYDAVYLETARKEHLPIATLDRALSEAAMKAGVPLFV